MSLIKNNDTNNFYPVSAEGTDWRCDWLFSTHRGCPFDCAYCSSKKYNIRFGGDPSEVRRLKTERKDGVINTRLPINSGIFVSPYNDIMTIPDEDIAQILDIIGQMKSSRFIFQTKDPAKYFDYIDLIPEGSWLGTTIETDKWFDYSIKYYSKAPTIIERAKFMVALITRNYKRFITIEPIMSYGTNLYETIDAIKPDLIFIGANTSKVKLPEPAPDELIELIEQLKKITTVYLKSNLKRLLPKGYKDV